MTSLLAWLSTYGFPLLQIHTLIWGPKGGGGVEYCKTYAYCVVPIKKKESSQVKIFYEKNRAGKLSKNVQVKFKIILKRTLFHITKGPFGPELFCMT